MRRVLLALVALLLSFQFSTAEAANRQLLGVPITQSEKEDLKSRAAWENWVDVIVGLNVPFAPEGTLTTAQVTAQRQEIASAASAVKALLDAETRETVREYVSVPFMAGSCRRSRWTCLPTAATPTPCRRTVSTDRRSSFPPTA